ncbi:MAG: chitin disaccharide deacetylase [Clostridium sp.]
MTKLIINADDFGLSRGVNYGIIDAHKRGVIRSTSIMAGMPGFLHAVELLKENKDLGCGVHLTLTAYKPLLNTHKVIVDKNGYLSREHIENNINMDNIKEALEEAYLEFKAQIEKVKSAGVEITHLDSHHHVHTMPELKPVIERLVNEYQLPIRGGLNYELDYDKVVPYETVFFDKTASIDTFKKHMEELKKFEVIDTMSHPGYVDKFLLDISSYTTKRAEEVEILTSDELKELLKENGIVVSNYREIV